MAHTRDQIERQLEANAAEWMTLHDLMNGAAANDWRRAGWQKRMRELSRADAYWATEFQKVTGLCYGTRTKPSEVAAITEKMNAEIDAEIAAPRILQAKKENLSSLLKYLQSDFERLTGAIQGQQDAAFNQWLGVGIMGALAREMGGINTLELVQLDIHIRKTTQDKIQKARRAYTRGDLAQAEGLAIAAGKELASAYAKFNKWKEAVEIGAARAETAITVCAAVSTAAVTGAITGGAALTKYGVVLESGAVAIAGEAGLQGGNLLAKGIDPGDTVSWNDAKKSFKEVALAGATGVAGPGVFKGASFVASRLAGRVALRILANGSTGQAALAIAGRKVSPKVVAYVQKVIEEYINANVKTIGKKLLDDKVTPDWDTWENLITPGLVGITGATLEALK